MLEFLSGIKKIIINYSCNGFEFNLDGEVEDIRDEGGSICLGIKGEEIDIPVRALKKDYWFDDCGRKCLHFEEKETELDIEILELAS